MPCHLWWRRRWGWQSRASCATSPLPRLQPSVQGQPSNPLDAASGRGVVAKDGSGSRSRTAAAAELQRLAALDRRALRLLPKDAFLRGWHALLFLFPELHPDNALDHGETIEAAPPNQLTLPGFEQLAACRYVRSGWPVALELLGREAGGVSRRQKLENATSTVSKPNTLGCEPCPVSAPSP